MPDLITKGVLAISFGPLAGDGGPSTALVAVGYTFRDSETSVTTADPTVNELYSNEADAPIDTTTIQGVTTIQYSVVPTTPEQLQTNFGGTVAGAGTVADPKIYSAPDTIVEREGTLKIQARSGTILQFNRVKLSAKFNYNMSPDSVMLIDITGQVLQPTKAGVKRFTITYPGVG